ncbi:phytanoyl-CoA dioxygenase family protein [Microbispora cellulosiformans]|uniref:Phytanoyl-CoA dioxygenase family protein n=1 Tax=Microbispora cellulosiformans TaxID=2614688 RepID=A0A5J5K8D1_9ACTN|nr:phytanoyl-CoA dioxygenase family protein [Microbispora cellulosiformans]KAA9379964.1 phytanoyl-CoA dioxygenase family protein [Microbispora cellulosiformans]
MLSDAQVRTFITDGFVRVQGAFPREIADECREIICRDLDADPGDPATWPRPVAARPDYAQAPFETAANTPRLHAAFDDLVGMGRWLPRTSLGGFVIRFPGDEPAVVDGWHVDVSFPGHDSDPGDYLTWRANVESRDRALLMFFLFSDIDENAAPTRLRVGSHLDVARILEPEGEDGLDARELARRAESAATRRPVVHATGSAGDVYLCHPFLVHAGQPNLGKEPRFLGQPKLGPAEPLQLDRADGAFSPVEAAIRRGLGR